MPLERDANGNILRAVGGFQATSPISGMGGPDSGMAHWVASHAKTGMVPLHKMPKTVRVENRAEKGYVKQWFGVVNGELYPEGARDDDPATWIQPGDTIYLPTEIALTLFGFFGSDGQKSMEERERVIKMFGDWQYEGIPFEGSRRQVSMHKVGPPPNLPDFILSFVDQRMKPLGEPVSLFDWCVGTKPRWHVTKDKAIKERDAEELERRIRWALQPAS